VTPLMTIQLVLTDKTTKMPLQAFTVSLLKNRLSINTSVTNSKG